MILTTAQAAAIYDAMCALNNVSANGGVQLSFVASDQATHMLRISVIENAAGAIDVLCGPQPKPFAIERHDSQAAFAAAYRLS